MANNKMLIDATQPEETRVVVVRGQKVEDFDFESASRRPLRGNIYLAKVTRVEPSLQAAFIEYGGNRHGFLAFSEIHPDYYQIPVADRQALVEEEARAEAEAERDDERRRSRRDRRQVRVKAKDRAGDADEAVSAPAAGPDGGEEPGEAGTQAPAAEGSVEEVSTADAAQAGPEPTDASGRDAEQDRIEEAQTAAEVGGDVTAEAFSEPQATAGEAGDGAPSEAAPPQEAHHPDAEEADEDEAAEGEESEVEEVETAGGGDALEELPERPRPSRRQYKIQEVIKRRQILLVQVVKEERGNKGAALTTYLSLAGRYSVLMPNTGKGGGISRKITNAEDRKRLKEIAGSLEVPEGMGIILRTAGASRSLQEIRRDYEYLMRAWENVRELTMRSTAPSLVYEEGSLIKRSLRDLYNKDMEEICVAGEEAYREAKDFMRMLMPGQARAVKPYREPQPLFAKAGVEAQLDALFSNHVTLRSGGYLVINPTEALVSIDVNSGRATREHNIEDTALKTNLEAAEEIARQLRLRDLAGLIVIDFIDMEEKRNNRAVEKRMADCLKNDRARIQVGRISAFGLLEMSRQRIRTGVLESSSVPCPHCGGTGAVRATSSVALHVLRAVEENLIKSAAHNLLVRTRAEVAFYILNQKRLHLQDLEARFGVSIQIVADPGLGAQTAFAVDRTEPATGVPARPQAPPPEAEDEDLAEDEADEVAAAEESEPAREEAEGDEGGRRRRRRRRRRGRGERGEAVEAGAEADEGDEDEAADADQDDAPAPEARRIEIRVVGEAADEGDEASPEGAAEAAGAGPDEGAETAVEDAQGAAEDASRGERPRRRGRRGGRGRDRARSAEGAAAGDDEASADDAAALPELSAAEASPFIAPPVPTEAAGSAAPEGEPVAAPEAVEAVEVVESVSESSLPPEPAPEPAPAPEAEPVAVVLTPPDPDRPKRGGWWSKAKAAVGGG